MILGSPTLAGCYRMLWPPQGDTPWSDRLPTNAADERIMAGNPGLPKEWD